MSTSEVSFAEHIAAGKSDSRQEHKIAHNLLDIMQSDDKTLFAPAINALMIEPLNASFSLVNSVSQSSATWINKEIGSKLAGTELKLVEKLSLGKAEPGSANYYSQRFFENAGSMIAMAAAVGPVGKAGEFLKEAEALASGGKRAEASIDEILKHARSANSSIGRLFNEKQVAMLDEFEKGYKLSDLRGIAVKSKTAFAEPTVLKDGYLKDAQVTSVTTYENGVKVYENSFGITDKQRPDLYGHATRITTDHDLFFKKEWGGKRTFLDGIGAGATSDAVFDMFRSYSTAYTNETGLFGPGSERVLLQNTHARVRLFDSKDEEKVLKKSAAVDSHIQKIVEKFDAPQSNSEIHSLLSQVPKNDRPLAEEIIRQSGPAIHGLALMNQMREVSKEAQIWWAKHANLSDIRTGLVLPAADSSDEAFSYLQMKIKSDIVTKRSIGKWIASTGQKEAVLLTGDVSKLSSQETEQLKHIRASGIPIGIAPYSFEHGISAIDLVKGTAASKLKFLIDEVKDKQNADSLLLNEAVAAVINKQAVQLAQDLDAELIGSDLQTQRQATGDVSDSIKSDLEKKYPLGDEREMIAGMLANDLRFYDLPEMLSQFKKMKQLVDEAAHSNTLYIHVGDYPKSQSLSRHLYQRVNDIGDDQFMKMSELKCYPKEKLEGKTLVLLDDAGYTGRQVNSDASTVARLTQHRNPIVIANLANYKKTYELASNREDARFISMESVLPYYERTWRTGVNEDFFHSAKGITCESVLTSTEIQAKRRASFFTFQHGVSTFSDVGNRLVFFYKDADCTSGFIQDFVGKHFNIKQ